MDKALLTKNESRKKRISSGLSSLYWSLAASAATIVTMTETVYADDIWTRLSSMVYDVYGKILGISTVVGVAAAAVALIVRMISHNPRAVDEATQWLKRIVITWLILNSLGFIVSYIRPLVSGGNFTV